MNCYENRLQDVLGRFLDYLAGERGNKLCERTLAEVVANIRQGTFEFSPEVMDFIIDWHESLYNALRFQTSFALAEDRTWGIEEKIA